MVIVENWIFRRNYFVYLPKNPFDIKKSSLAYFSVILLEMPDLNAY